MPTPRDWDGSSYDRVSGPMERLGRGVLDRLPLAGDETVLDAGCGSGRVTQALIDRLPSGRVIGVDASADMIRVARERLPAGTELHVQDLARLDLGDDTQVDAILSTATFHWIADHDALFAALARVLRAGGRLEAQCGGVGNVAGVRAAAQVVGAREPYRDAFAGWSGPWNFSTPEDAKRRLVSAGFTDVTVSLVPRPVHPDGSAEYLRTIVLGSHIERLPDDLKDPYINDVAAALREKDDRVIVDYVRLNLSAVRAPRGAS